MKNLAHDEECDRLIRQELDRCGIPIIPAEKARSDVPYKIRGKLGGFEFDRYWYYWSVEGMVPLEVAKKLYDDPVGKTDIRCNGHCGCPLPEQGLTWIADGKVIVKTSELAQYEHFESKGYIPKGTKDQYIFSDEPEKIGKAFVDGYHIDTELGLYIFVNALKAAGLVPSSPDSSPDRLSGEPIEGAVKILGNSLTEAKSVV